MVGIITLNVAIYVAVFHTYPIGGVTSATAAAVAHRNTNYCECQYHTVLTDKRGIVFDSCFSCSCYFGICICLFKSAKATAETILKKTANFLHKITNSNTFSVYFSM